MKKGNNILSNTFTIDETKLYDSMNGMRLSTSKILALPILEALHKRSISKAYLVKRLNELGFKYNYSSLVNTLNGNNTFIRDFDYFGRIYYVMGLPMPTIESLCSVNVRTGGKVKLLNNPKHKVVKPKVKKD